MRTRRISIFLLAVGACLVTPVLVAQSRVPQSDPVGGRVARLVLLRDLPRALIEKRLVAALADPAARVRIAALQLLGARRLAGAAILVRLKHDVDARVRKAALLALARFDSGIYGKTVLDHLQHSAPELRSAAIDALETMRPAGAHGRLVRMLYDASLSVRTTAVQALSRWPEAGTAQRLTDLLADPTDTLRRAAIAGLVRLRARGAVPRLIQRLSAVELGERQLILDALGRIGDSRAIPALLPLIWNKNALVSAAVIEALGRLKARAAVRPLFRYLTTVGFPGDVAVRALNRIGGDLVRQQTLELLRRRPVGDVAKHLLTIVAHLRIRASVPVLLAMLRGAKNEKLAIIKTLRALADPRAGSALATLLAAPRRVSSALQRQQALLALGALKQRHWVSSVAANLTSARPYVVLAAIDALGEIGGPEAVVQLLAATKHLAGGLLLHALEVVRGLGPFSRAALLLPKLGDADGRVREMIAQALAASGDLSLIPALVRLARSEVFLGNRDALRVLGSLLRKRRATDGLAVLVKRLSDDDLETQLSALQALGEVGLAAAAKRIRKLAGSSEAEVRAQVADVLGDCPKDDDTIELLVRLARDSSARVRAHAVYALGTFRVSAQLTLFRDRLRLDPAPAVRSNAARALGRLKATVARPDLERCLADELDWVVASCAWSLAQMPISLPAKRLNSLLRLQTRWFVRGNLMRLAWAKLSPTARRQAESDWRRRDPELLSWTRSSRHGPETELAMMQLVDQRYRAMSDLRYLLIFPDGEIKVGFTNRFGTARQDHVPKQGMRWDFPRYRP
ncbi:MAG: HEAT repeat domain-containing protein [Myxococcales bacterium]|nr:HEAT repeat domain-containing protein [Myxococcales bacterium]